MTPDNNRTAPHAPEIISADQDRTTDHPRAEAPSTGTIARTPSDVTRLEETAQAGGVPGYELLEELGRGGMGVVYRARHLRLNRIVALKMVLGARAAQGPDLIRFLAEAEAIASVRHPNVVQVHEYGEASGRPYMVLELLPGGTLADRIQEDGRLTPTEAVAVVGKIARGVAAAHALSMVHRDLKPQNILFGEGDEPKVTDFGLAKRGTGADLTQTGAVMGTPAYMAPEQAGGKTKYVGPPADVWALGVILYECLTGVRPFQAQATGELLAQIINAPPAPFVTGGKPVPHDLELICRKCLEKHPADRYPTAAELAADLERFARGEPISVRPAGGAERALKWARRNPAVAAALILGVLLVVVGGLGATAAVMWRKARATGATLAERNKEVEGANVEAQGARTEALHEKATAEVLKTKAERLSDELAEADATRTVDVAYRDWFAGNGDRARELLEGVPVGLRGWEWRYVRRLVGDPLVTLSDPKLDNRPGTGDGHTAFSPDGTRVLFYHPSLRNPLISFRRQCYRVWDARTGKVVAQYGDDAGNENEYDPQFTPAGGRALFEDPHRGAPTGAVADIRVVDVFTGKPVCRLKDIPQPLAPGPFHFTTDLKTVIGVCGDRTVRVWDAVTGEELLRLAGEFDSTSGATRPSAEVASISPDGLLAVTVNNSNHPATARVWDLKTNSVRCTLAMGDSQGTSRLTFTPDGKRIVSVANPHAVRVWDSATGASIANVGFSPAGGSTYQTTDWNRVIALTCRGNRVGRVRGTSRPSRLSVACF